MVTLSEWITKYAKLPLIRLVAFSLAVQTGYFCYLAYTRYHSQLESFKQIKESVSLGAQQSNRPLIESALMSALGDPGVAAAALCAGPEITILYPPSAGNICRQSPRSLTKWEKREPLIGLQGQDLLLVLSPFSIFGTLYFLIIVALAMLAAIIWTISRVRGRFQSEILNPLCDEITADRPLSIVELEKLRLKNKEHILLLRELAVSKATSDLAAQVAHDIRSPLTALDAALRHADQLPEKQRVIVRHAANRIRDIANNLLEKNRQQPGTATSTAGGHAAGEPLDVHLLSSLIDPVVTEKRLQFESKPGVTIDFGLTNESYGLFSKVQPVEFRRMISNLVNNAVEALGDKGAVDVRLVHEDKTIVLTISDDGKGIPPEILAKLGRRGETHGKAGGSGLGLFHARSTAESWGGSLAITSAPGKGTTVTIKLPPAAAPDYFVSALKLAPGRPILVLDDDAGVHHLWRGRFESARISEHNIEDHHFNEPEQLRAWLKANPDKVTQALCLFDYELAGFKETGLSLAEEFGLCARTILVTSRSEESRIISECTRLGVRMIPKGLASFVPVSCSSPALAPARAVLLDDDAITHMNWEWSAGEHGVELKAFTDPAAFMAALGDFPKDMPLYIDSELGDNIKGENIAAELKEKGFTNIYLATGHPPERFAHLPWLRVVTKEAPWGEKTEG